jgi:hypothetical protein
MTAEVIDVDPTTGEIVPARSPQLLTVAPSSDVVALQRAYAQLCADILTPEDYQRVGGQSFKKKQAWRKLAAAFNVSDTLVSKEYDRDPETGRTIRAEYLVRATAPNGRTSEGIGIASIWDKTTFTNPEHDIPATAHTRAKNRAFSDLFGLGEVSAEEMYGADTTNPPADSATQAQRTRRGRPPKKTAQPLELEPGEAELEARILSNDAVRAAFRQWRADKKLPWPPADGEQFLQMVREVDAIEAEMARDDYDPPVDKPDTVLRNKDGQPSDAEWNAYQGGAGLGT